MLKRILAELNLDHEFNDIETLSSGEPDLV
jgi:hypothetical protein